jgi:hypothetical protein
VSVSDKGASFLYKVVNCYKKSFIAPSFGQNKKRFGTSRKKIILKQIFFEKKFEPKKNLDLPCGGKQEKIFSLSRGRRSMEWVLRHFPDWTKLTIQNYD